MKKVIVICVIGIGILVAIALWAGQRATDHATAVETLQSAPASVLVPTGELAALFEFGGISTDLQRENKMKAIKGSVVVWQLPVFEVKRDGKNYKVQTQDPHVFGTGEAAVPTLITLTPLSANDQQVIEQLKTGDIISFKGVISGVRLRHLVIEPAILVAAPVLQTPPSESESQNKNSTSTDDSSAEALPEFFITEEVKLRNGVIAITPTAGSDGFLLNGKGVKDNHGEFIAATSIIEHWQFGERDMAIINNSCREEECPDHGVYRVVFVHSDGTATVSDSFGNGLQPVITHVGDNVELRFGDSTVLLEDGLVKIPDDLKK